MRWEVRPHEAAWYRGAVSEEDRQRRRLGDATRDRIADLADGWKLPGQEAEKKAETARSETDAGATEPYEKAGEGLYNSLAVIDAEEAATLAWDRTLAFFKTTLM